MFLAMTADKKRAASWREGRKTAKTRPESDFGWVLIGWILGRLLTFLSLNPFGPTPPPPALRVPN